MNEILIPRPTYLDRLWNWRDSNLIKVVMGPRRCGKSFLLKMFRDRLLDTKVSNDQLLVYELDRFENDRFLDPKVLHADILSRRVAGKKSYVFIDEIQECQGFEKMLSSLEHHDDLDIYVTGSNAYMLSGELMTYMTGRYLALEMLPLSFAEFRSAVEVDGLTPDEDFRRYLQIGSYPAVVPHRHDPTFIEPYYELLINSMLYKDVAQRFRIKDTRTLRNIVDVLTTSLGGSISTRRIKNTLKSVAGIDMHQQTLSNYLSALVECYMFAQAKRFDVRGNALLEGQEKFYLTDPGMCNRLIATSVLDLGHLLENVVFLELKRRYRQVVVGKVSDYEVDFVVKDGQQTSYFQVALSVLDPTTLTRELRAFEDIQDKHPCYLLTLDRFGADSNHAGIQQLNVVDWLLAV